MKIRLAICLFLLTIFLTPPAWGRSNSHFAKQSAPSDPGYVFALAAADHFLHAWQTGDVEGGIVLLSDGLRHSQNADQVEQIFSKVTERAFEITRGHGHPGRYSFPVVLLTFRGSSSGGSSDLAQHVTRKFSEIVMIETGKNDWVIDKLP